MDIQQFRNHKPGFIGEDQVFKSAVCIPLIQTADGQEVLFQVRAGSIADQPGDICLPGGRMEAGESPEEAAVRELQEELLLDRQQIEVIGPSDFYHSENIIIYPYLVSLKNYQGTFSKEEVDHIFTVPLQFFLNKEPEMYDVCSHIEPGEDFPYDRIVGGKDYRWRKRVSKQLFYEYEGYHIWGLTAKIMYSFAGLLKES